MRDTSTTESKWLKNWLMLDLIERTIGLRTRRLCQERGHAEGRELDDWLKAASEVLLTLHTAQPAAAVTPVTDKSRVPI